jgi:hypothetical protein
VVVLLEEHPLQDLAALVAIIRQVGSALGEIPDNGVGLAQEATIFEPQDGDPQSGVLTGEEILAIAAIRNADRDALVRQVEMRQHQANLVGVARGNVVIQL